MSTAHAAAEHGERSPLLGPARSLQQDRRRSFETSTTRPRLDRRHTIASVSSDETEHEHEREPPATAIKKSLASAFSFRPHEQERDASDRGDASEETDEDEGAVEGGVLWTHHHLFEAPMAEEVSERFVAPEPTEVAPLVSAVTVIEYGPETINEDQLHSMNELTDDLKAPLRDGASVRWVKVDGLDLGILKAIQQEFGLSDFQIADITRPPSRPKVIAAAPLRAAPPDGAQADVTARVAFFIASVVHLEGAEDNGHGLGHGHGDGHGGDEKGGLRLEQVNIVLAPNIVVTITESAPVGKPGKGRAKAAPDRCTGTGDVLRMCHAHLFDTRMSLRSNDASFLACALIDASIGHALPILESYQDEMEELDDEVLTKASPLLIRRMHALERDLLAIRRVIMPMRDAILGEIKNRSIAILDVLDNLLDFGRRASEVADSVQMAQLNRTFKYLALVETLFVPGTFLACVEGMLFEEQPEVHWRYGYPVFWVVCFLVFAAQTTEVCSSSQEANLNEIIRVLTLFIGSAASAASCCFAFAHGHLALFTPGTFLASVYAMSFDMPETKWRYGYAYFWALTILATAVTTAFFYRRGWLASTPGL
eukprot:tig00020537_g10287.t1